MAVRPVETPERGEDGLILEPEDSEPETLIAENHARERFAKKANYADGIVGDGNTVDPEGRYNCGRCNQAEGTDCLFWNLSNLDLEAGSCRSYEFVDAGDPERQLRLGGTQAEAVMAASYGVAKNGVGFGCSRCPLQQKSKRGEDSYGRDLWCGEGGFRVFPRACCEFNAAEVLPMDETGNVELDVERAGNSAWQRVKGTRIK